MNAHRPECSGWIKTPVRPDPDCETVTAATCADCGEQVGTITLTPIDAPAASYGQGDLRTAAERAI